MGGHREEHKREILWQRDKVGREKSQSGCQDQSVLSWRFNVMEQCFLVQDNGEQLRMEEGKKRGKFAGSKLGRAAWRVPLSVQLSVLPSGSSSG